MNDEEMRAAIAGAAKFEKISGGCWYNPNRDEHYGDILSDLNAMHEAEKVLDKEDKLMAYLFNLSAVVGEEPGFQTIALATARQRAIAFCRTLFPERFKP